MIAGSTSVTEKGVGITKALHDVEYVQFADGVYQINQDTGVLTLVQPVVDYPLEVSASRAIGMVASSSTAWC